MTSTTLEALLAHIRDDEERRDALALAARVHDAETAGGRGGGADADVTPLLEDIRKRLAWSLRAKRHPLPGTGELRELIRRHFDPTR